MTIQAEPGVMRQEQVCALPPSRFRRNDEREASKDHERKTGRSPFVGAKNLSPPGPAPTISAAVGEIGPRAGRRETKEVDSVGSTPLGVRFDVSTRSTQASSTNLRGVPDRGKGALLSVLSLRERVRACPGLGPGVRVRARSEGCRWERLRLSRATHAASSATNRGKIPTEPYLATLSDCRLPGCGEYRDGQVCRSNLTGTTDRRRDHERLRV